MGNPSYPEKESGKDLMYEARSRTNNLVFLLHVVPDFFVGGHSSSSVDSMAVEGGEHPSPEHQDTLEEFELETHDIHGSLKKSDLLFDDAEGGPNHASVRGLLIPARYLALQLESEKKRDQIRTNESPALQGKTKQ